MRGCSIGMAKVLTVDALGEGIKADVSFCFKGGGKGRQAGLLINVLGVGTGYGEDDGRELLETAVVVRD